MTTDALNASILSTVRRRALAASNFPYASPGFWLFQSCVLAVASLSYLGMLVSAPGSWAAILGYAVAFCGFSMLAAAVGHQGFHLALVRSKKVNMLLGYTAFLLIGVDGQLWRLRHLHDHHPHPNTLGHDNDMDSSVFLRLAPYAQLRWYHRFQHLYAPLVYSVGTAITVFYSDLFCLRNAIRRGIGFRSVSGLVAGFLLRKAFFILLWFVVPVCAWAGHSPAWVIAYFCIASVPVAWLLLPIGMAHMNAHAAFYDRENPAGFAETQIETTVDFCPTNRFMSWLYGGLNSHLAHHLFPGVASCHHAALYAELRERAPGVYARKIDLGLMGLYFSHFRYLRGLGCGGVWAGVRPAAPPTPVSPYVAGSGWVLIHQSTNFKR